MPQWGESKCGYPGLQPTAFHWPSSPDEEGSDDEDDVLSGEEEHPTGMGTSSTRQSPQTPTMTLSESGPPVKKKRRTATAVEVEKAKLAQAKEKNWMWKELQTNTKLITECPDFSTLVNRTLL